MKIISLYTDFGNVGGAQNMCISIHKGLAKKEKIKKAWVSSFSSYQKVDTVYKQQIRKKEYIKFNPFKLIISYPDAIFISHHRKITTLLVLTAKLLFKNRKIIHVAHTQSSTLKYVTFLPKRIICVSHKVNQNIKEYFNAKNGKVIYNGINKVKNSKRLEKSKKLKILWPGKIYGLKQQLIITKKLKEHLPKNVTILFAGDGPQLDMLKAEVQNAPQLKVLGYVRDMETLYKEVDFVLLFSKNEGLPLSLIEAISYGVPCICNDVGGNVEVIQNGKNGLVVSTVKELKNTLQMLPEMTNENYADLSKNAIEVYRNKFSYDKMIENYYNYIMHEFK